MPGVQQISTRRLLPSVPYTHVGRLGQAGMNNSRKSPRCERRIRRQSRSGHHLRLISMAAEMPPAECNALFMPPPQTLIKWPSKMTRLRRPAIMVIMRLLHSAYTGIMSALRVCSCHRDYQPPSLSSLTQQDKFNDIDHASVIARPLDACWPS